MSNTYKKGDFNINFDKESMRKVGNVVKVVVAVIILALLGFNSVYTIKEQEQAVVTTFGVEKTVTQSGLQFKIPFIQQVTKVDTTIKGLAIGYDIETNESIEDESLMITNDFNFVNVDFFVEYKVYDPSDYLYNSENPEMILKNVAQSSIRNIVGSYKVDEVLTTGKNEIQAKIKETITMKLEEQDIGLQLINITIQDANPPTTEVMEAFKAVETAKQGKETALNNAEKYRSEKKPATEAQVDKILQEAETQKQSRVLEAQAVVARFNEMYKEYIKNPEVTKSRMFYEAMEDILPSLEVIIDSGSDSVQKVLPLDEFANITNNNSGDSTKESDQTAAE